MFSYPALSMKATSGGRTESSKQTSMGAERTETRSKYHGTRLSVQGSASTCDNDHKNVPYHGHKTNFNN